MKKIVKKTVLITGAAGGIGLACAQAFADEGYQLVLTDLDDAALKRSSAKLNIASTAILTAKVDVCSRSSIEQAFNAGCSKFGKIDTVHANAGVSTMGWGKDLSEQDWDFNFAVNAKGVFLTNQVALKHFLTEKIKGVIVNTASLAAKVGAPLLAHYSASKFAVLGWTQALAREHATDGIRINAVCPGFVKTAMQEREIIAEAKLLNKSPADVVKSYIAQTPLGRLETPADVAGVVVFLASDQARFMTGQGVNVTGGVYMG